MHRRWDAPLAHFDGDPMADTDVESRDAPKPFQAVLESHRDTVVIVARGEIDLASVDELDERFREVLDAGFRRAVLDLREVLFIDSTGLGRILTMNETTSSAGMAFELVRGPAPVHRLFELTRTEGTLRFIEAREIDTGPA
jgi:anti-anti-sigma factor